MPPGLSRPLAAVARRIAAPPAGTDADLLARYHLGRDEAAFAALVQRHGPAVRAVARARLTNPADADDVVQATFLVLARDAGKVRESVAGWLVRVAHLSALQVRRNQSRRRTGPLPDGLAGTHDPTAEATRRQVRGVVAEELAALPDKFRGVVVLCGLDGLTAAAAADRLGIPKGTADTRLAAGKRLLAVRLARRGLAAGAGVAALRPLDGVAADAAESLARAAVGYAAGQSSTPVSLLADGVHPAMSSHIRLFALGLVAAVLTGTAGTALNQTGPAPQPAPSKPTASTPEKPPAVGLTVTDPTPATNEAVSPPPRTEADVRARLAKPVRLPADLSTLTLGALLAELNGQGLIVRLDMPAIMRYGLPDGAQLFDAKLRGRADPRLPLADVLDEVLCQLDLGFPVAYRVRGNQLLISPAVVTRSPRHPHYEQHLAEQLLGEPVHVEFKGLPLSDAVAELRARTGANIVLDPKAVDAQKATLTGTFDDVRLLSVLRLLADMAGLEVVTMGNVYYLTTPKAAAPLQRTADKDAQLAPGAGMG